MSDSHSKLGSQPLEIHSEEVQEIVSHIPGWVIRSGISMIFLVFLVLLIVCCYIKYPDLIKANVTITTSPSPLPLVARTTGNIVFLKNDRNLVKRGEVVAYIKSTTNFTDAARLETMLNLQQFNFKDPLVLGDLQSYYEAFLNSLEVRKLFIENDIFNKQTIQQRKQIANYLKLKTSLINQYGFFREELKIAYAKFKRDSILYTQKVIAPVNFEESLGVYLQQRRALENVKASITNNDIQIDLLEKQGLEIEIQKTEQENKLKQDCDRALHELLTKIAKWKETYLLTSPIDGNVAYLGFYENESFIEAGKPVLSIIPTNGVIQAQAELPLARSGKVKIGQKVNIRLENFPHAEFGMLIGTISEISALPAEGKYLVKIHLEKKLTTTYKRTLPFKHQLKGETEIITEDLMLIERILYQFKSLLNTQKL